MADNIVRHIVVFSLCVWVISGEKVWPCNNARNNYTCVGAYLNKYSNCSLDLIGDVNLDPHYYNGTLTVSTPYFNTTEKRTNLTVYGVSQAYLKDFFYNDTSRKAVLTVFYPYIRMEGVTTIQFQVPEDEGFSVETTYNVTYNNVTLTTLFDDYENTSLDTSTTSAYIPILPTYSGGEGLEAAALTNERVANFVAAAAKYPDVTALEAFSSRGWALVRFFVDYRLCDYDPTVSETSIPAVVYEPDYIYTQ